MERPQGRRTNTKIRVQFRLVPEYTIFYSVTSRRVVENETLKVFRARVHHLVEHFERRKDSEKVFVNLFAVLEDVFAEDEYVVYVCAEVGRQVHAVLHRQHEEDFPVPTVHETLSDAHVLHKLSVVHAVVEQHERAAVLLPLTHQSLLTSQDPFYRVSVIVAIDEEIWDELFVVVVAILRSGHDNPGWEVLLVVQDVSHEDGLAGVSLPYEDANLVVRHCFRAELSELQLAH